MLELHYPMIQFLIIDNIAKRKCHFNLKDNTKLFQMALNESDKQLLPSHVRLMWVQC